MLLTFCPGRSFAQTSNQRIETFIKFWGFLKYHHRGVAAGKQDWDLILINTWPDRIGVVFSDTLSYYKALTKLAVSLNDGHAQLASSVNYSMIKDKLFGKYTAPFYVAIVKDGVVITKLGSDSLCLKAGIQVGDMVIAIDREPVQERIKRLASLILVLIACINNSPAAPKG